MSNIIDDLLALARISRTPLRREPLNLTDLARSVVEELQKHEPHRNVDVQIEPGMTAEADPRFVAVLLTNLLGQRLEIHQTKRTRRDPRREPARAKRKLAFFVRDNGAGFDMRYAEKLFQPFQRLHAQSEFEGTGIGLATVHRIVSHHGGRIWAEGAPGEGAMFAFTLEDA